MDWPTILAVASAVVLLSNAAKSIASIWQAAKAPNAKQDERINALEKWKSGDFQTWKESVDRKLQNDYEHLQKVDDANRVSALALIALLDHGIAGNNIEQMKEAKQELAQHLTSK